MNCKSEDKEVVLFLTLFLGRLYLRALHHSTTCGAIQTKVKFGHLVFGSNAASGAQSGADQHVAARFRWERGSS